MRRARDYAWTAVGFCAVAFSLWLLVDELRGLSPEAVLDGFSAIPLHRWLLAFASTFVAYAALAWYDRIGLAHLGHKLPWGFISIVSFTTYALSHNIGASILSGAVVRYRAYSTKGLNAREVGLLVAFCSFTFILGELLLRGLILTFDPEIVDRWSQFPHWAARVAPPRPNRPRDRSSCRQGLRQGASSVLHWGVPRGLLAARPNAPVPSDRAQAQRSGISRP